MGGLGVSTRLIRKKDESDEYSSGNKLGIETEQRNDDGGNERSDERFDEGEFDWVKTGGYFGLKPREVWDMTVPDYWMYLEGVSELYDTDLLIKRKQMFITAISNGANISSETEIFRINRFDGKERVVDIQKIDIDAANAAILRSI